MKFCQSHWDRLRVAIESRGLGHLVAANGRDAHARAVAELQGQAEVSDYDPLMAAHWMIVGRATDAIGLGIFAGGICPVCELLKITPPPPEGHRYKTNDEYFTVRRFIDTGEAILRFQRFLNMTPIDGWGYP